MLLLLAASPAQPQSPLPSPSVAAPSTTSPNTSETVRIATRLIEPDAFEENGQIVGFSADLGRSVLEQLQWKAVLKTYPDVPELLNAIRLGQADLGVAAIAITSQREQDFDFSYPILSGELQIMVLTEVEQNLWQRLFAALLSADLLNLFGAVALFMLIPAHIVWYFERREDGLIENPSYIPGIFEALWWTILTLVTQPDEMPRGLVGRIVALFWLLAGIVFVSYFTAVITTAFTVEELEGYIRELSDLQDHPVAVLADSETIDYLQAQNIQQVIEFSQPKLAYQALLTEEVDALIAPSPLLLYYASHAGRGKVRIVGTPFRNQFYSIVMPKDSPYRRPVNRAILTLKENGTYQQIYQKWFGVEPQD